MFLSPAFISRHGYSLNACPLVVQAGAYSSFFYFILFYFLNFTRPCRPYKRGAYDLYMKRVKNKIKFEIKSAVYSPIPLTPFSPYLFVLVFIFTFDPLQTSRRATFIDTHLAIRHEPQ